MWTSNVWSDRIYLKILYRLYYGKRLDLNNPLSFTEKIQWLKLYNRNVKFTLMVDKYEAKKMVKHALGEEYVIPCYGVYNYFDEIDFSALPNQFVLKCTHDSGSYVICDDIKTFDFEKAKALLEKGLKKNFYSKFKEWAYKDVKPRILVEKYIPSLGKKDSVEYKLTCCDGEVKTITVCGGIPHTKSYLRTNDHFTKTWEKQNWWAVYKSSGKRIEKPAQMDEMICLSEKLSKDIPYIRIDWYVIDNKPVFGEFTFYTWGGFLRFNPKEWDEVIGSWITLPNVIDPNENI